MASGQVNRIKRPNTWLQRPMLQNREKALANRSRPHMALFGHGGRSMSVHRDCVAKLGWFRFRLLILDFCGFCWVSSPFV